VDDHSEPTQRPLPEVLAEPLSDSAWADFVTAPGQFSWPPTGSSMTAYGQNLMTADTWLVDRFPRSLTIRRLAGHTCTEGCAKSLNGCTFQDRCPIGASRDDVNQNCPDTALILP
jgi:hypothetical protein